jgi:hypothetical protein
MSRKHYTEVAAILSDQRRMLNRDSRPSACAVDALSNVALEMALMFKRDNPRFAAGRFFDAAGFPELTGSRMGLN